MGDRSSCDESVILTADDAILSKHATVQAGYYEDPFLSPMAHQAVGLGGRKRPVQPMIQHGTHARVACIDRVVRTFLQDHHAAQVVVLGSGLDTSFFRHATPTSTWYEIDHLSVINQKTKIIKQSPTEFQNVQVLQQPTAGRFRLTHKNCECHLLAYDLREDPSQLIQTLIEAGLKVDRPMLIVSECVQMYLPQQTTIRLWKSFQCQCPKSVLCIYDALLKRNSNFGTVMENHLKRAHVISHESSLVQTRTLEQHTAKLVQDCGCRSAIGCDMWTAHQSIVTNEERMRARQCCLLDEMEEFMLIMQHYCFVVACASDWGKEYCGPQLGFDSSKCVLLHNSSR